MGMGDAFTAAATDASSLYWNPASLTSIPGQSLALMHAPYLDSSYYDYAAYGANLGRYGALGASLQYFSAGKVAQTDANGGDLGSVSPNDLAVSAGYAYDFAAPGQDGFRAGVSGKIIQSRLADKANTSAFDLGALSPAIFNDRFRLGAAVVNLGGKLNYGRTAQDLPTTARFGGLLNLTPSWLLTADVGAPRGGTVYLAAGTEYVFGIVDGWGLALRGGFNSSTINDVSGLTALSMGF